jgi:flagellar biosynthetic protein FliR
MFADLSMLAPWAIEYVLVIARLSFIVILLPGIGDDVVPVRVRLMLLLGLSFMFVSADIVKLPTPETLAGLLAALLGEAAIGIIIGIGLRMTVWVLSITGSVIAQSIGLAQFLGVTVDTEAQTITANILTMAGITLLLTLNYHMMVIASVIDLYQDMPVGVMSMIGSGYAISDFYSAFVFAIMLAWPFVAVNLLYNIALGFINKALPQLMVAFVGAPFMVGAGVFFLAVSIASMLLVWLDRVPAFLRLI